MTKEESTFPRWAKMAIAATIVLLAILIPLTSAFPDGLERVAENLGIGESEQLWEGAIPDYFINVGNEWTGTLISGLIGMAIVGVLSGGIVFAYTKLKRNR
ncbi:MAG: PDGLE domain-containing protein [Promethearchaeota archaeon]